MNTSALTIAPIAVDSKTCAAMLGIGTTLLDQLRSSGKIFQPTKISSKIVWPVVLLRLWVLNDCPARDSQQWRELIKGIRK